MMKKLFFLIPIALVFSFSITDSGISKKDRKFAKNYLEETRSNLINTVAGLSEEQLNYKAAPDRWSIKECIQHIAIAEASFWKMIEAGLKAGPNPEKRSEIKATDEEMVKFMTDRSKKFQAPESFKPENSPYANASDALASFKESREKLIKFMKNTKDDLRNYVIQIPVGVADAYQMVLLTGAHSNRHTQQIAEVKADPNFPK
jgi:hypothetical protein